MKKYIAWLCCVLAGFAAFSQTNTAVAEIEKQLRAATVDSEQVRYLYRLGDIYRDIDLNKADFFADTAMKKSVEINWQKGMAALHLLKGNILQAKGKGGAALQHYLKAYNISSRRNDKKAIASALNDIATEYHNRGDYVKAYHYQSRCLTLGQELGDDRVTGLANQNIGKIFFIQEEYDKALTFQQQAFKHFTALGNELYIAQINEALGSIYYEMANYSQAEIYFSDALGQFTRLENLNGIATMNSRMAILYEVTKGVDSSLVYALRAQKIWDSFNPKEPNSVFNMGNIGHSYFRLAQSRNSNLSDRQKKQYLQQAVAYTERCVQYAIENKDREGEYYYLGNLSDIKELQGDYQEALHYRNRSTAIKDSIFSQKNRNKIAAVENARALEARDKQIKINQLALTGERRTRAALIAGACLLFVIGCLLFYQNQTRKKTNITLMTLNNELDEANKVKTKFFGILSHDLRSPVVNVINFLHLQKEMPDLFSKERQVHHQKELTESAENLLETMEAMLLWSKSQMEHFAPQKKSILVQNLFEFLQKQFSAPGISFQDPGQLTVSSDEDYLKTIMYNLTSNAVKALGNTEKPQIIWKAWQNENQVKLSITDNGPGVHPEQLDALYNENAVVGTRHGLGLHLIRDLAKAIDCRVLHQPGLEKGSVFQIIM